MHTASAGSTFRLLSAPTGELQGAALADFVWLRGDRVTRGPAAGRGRGAAERFLAAACILELGESAPGFLVGLGGRGRGRAAAAETRAGR